MDDTPIVVIEGGQVYLVRADHIGRPSFATTLSGTVVWRASYLPFGGVHVTSGAPVDLRFPGQWFQAESGLYQNWMRDYDPTTGRYVEADPLGLVDGASVYGYAGQNPGRWVDPRGLFTLGDAVTSLRQRTRQNNPRSYFPPNKVFDEWLRLERENNAWLDELLACLCNLEDAGSNFWQDPRYFPKGVPFHLGGYYDVRSHLTAGGHSSQCVYDQNGNLSVTPPGAGSADYRGYSGLSDPVGATQHYLHDVAPYNLAVSTGRVSDYYSVRPVTP